MSHSGRSLHEMVRRDAMGALFASGLSLGGNLGTHVSANVGVRQKKKAKSVLMLFASGGQSQFETWDPKPHAPVEVRGAFGTIGTATPGLRICEHLPRLASLSQRYCVYRSMSHDDLDHGTASYLTLTGRHHPLKSANPNPSPADHPTLAAAFTKIMPSRGIPFSAVNINGPMLIPFTPGPGQDGGFLGKGPSPAIIENPSLGIEKSLGISPVADLPMVRIDGRRVLAEELESLRRVLEGHPQAKGWDQQSLRAYSLLKTPRFRQALNLNNEKPDLLSKYGHGRTGRACIMGRRLIEAGVPWVTVFLNHSIRGQDDYQDSPDWYGWDTHNDIFESMKNVLLPRFDLAISALIEDMETRSLLQETLVVIVGEFGRAPFVATEKRFAGSSPGRKHWAGAYSMVALGAGIPGGRIIGETDKWGGSVQSHRGTPGDLAATLFNAMGIEQSATFSDPTGRVVPLAEGKPISSWWDG